MRAESASRRPLADHDPFDPGKVAPGFGVNEAQSRREAENVAALPRADLDDQPAAGRE